MSEFILVRLSEDSRAVEPGDAIAIDSDTGVARKIVSHEEFLTKRKEKTMPGGSLYRQDSDEVRKDIDADEVGEKINRLVRSASKNGRSITIPTGTIVDFVTDPRGNLTYNSQYAIHLVHSNRGKAQLKVVKYMAGEDPQIFHLQ
tara:strand:- start:573 stop:1007 length:435 start_codon:yes stop_codon:yes gene_type:complete